MFRYFAVLAALAAASACATLSPRSEIESRFIEFGLSPQRAECLARELDEDLDRSDLRDVADFVQGLNEATSPGGALDALLRIDNPRIAAAIGTAGVSCAFRR